MPRLSIEGAELLWGESRGVRLIYLGGGDTAIVLSGPNEHPCPDLRASETGELEGVELGAPPHPSAYQVYIRQLTSIGTGGGHVALKGTQMLRQNYSRVPWERPFYDQKLPLITGDPLPDTGKDSRIPRPVSIRAEAVTVAGALGYPAGDYWLSYAGIVGSPTTSPFLTSAAPPVQIELSQGQIIAVSLPGIPEAWTGIALLLSPVDGSPDDLRIQRRIDLRGRYVPEVILSGPYGAGGRRIVPGGRPNARNATYIASEDQYPAPGISWAPSNLNTWQLDTRLSYRFLTPRGQTASQRERPVRVAALQRGKALTWRPRNPPAGASRWIPEFLGADGKWYTLESAERGYPLGRAARIHTNQISSESYQDPSSGQFTSDVSAQWKKQGDAPVELARQYEDESGIEHPKEPLSEPEIRTPEEAGSLLAPGRHQVRTTNVADDSESAPSDPATVTLRDSGIARGQAASGVTDQAIRVYRTPSQYIANARFIETDPRTGVPDLEWEFPVGGPDFTLEDGCLKIDDPPPPPTPEEPDPPDPRPEQPPPIETKPCPLPPPPKPGRPRDPGDPFSGFPFEGVDEWILRLKCKINRRISGNLEVVAKTLDEQDNELASSIIKRFTTGDFPFNDVTVKAKVSRQDNAQIRIPDSIPTGKAKIKVAVRTAGKGRDTAATISDIGLFRNTSPVGAGAPAKRIARDVFRDVGLASVASAGDGPEGIFLPAASADRRPVPSDEPTSAAYLPGAYCRVIDNPSDGAYEVTAKRLELEDFEDGEANEGWSVQGAEYGGISDKCSLQDLYGLKVEGGAHYRYKSFYRQGASSLAASMWFANAYTGNVPATHDVLAITASENSSDLLAYVRHNTAGDLVLRARDGASERYAVFHRDLLPGEVVRIEVIARGAGTANGEVEAVLVKDGERHPGATLTGLDWTSLVPYGVRYGVDAGATGRYLLDRIHVTEDGETSREQIPGNYIEYYGPEGTQRHPENFATGMRIPVTAGQRRTVSAYLGTEGAGIGTALLKTAIKDAAGNVLLENPYLSENLSGDNYWFRAHHTYTVPRGGVYLELVRNDAGTGLVRAMGFMDNPGALEPFTNENATDGYLRGRMRLSTPGELPVKSLGFTTGWRGRDLVITHEENGGGPLTSHQLLTRVASSERGLNAAPWRGELQDIPADEQQNEFVEVEAALYSQDPTLSPALRSVFIDLKRPLPVLCRADGGEYPGGVFAFDIQPVTSPREANVISYASGAMGVADYSRGNPPDILSFSLRAFDRASAEEINRSIGVEELILEHGDVRYTLILTDGGFEGQHQRSGGFVSYDAEVEAAVVSREAW